MVNRHDQRALVAALRSVAIGVRHPTVSLLTIGI
jgi:hypothetical protein